MRALKTESEELGVMVKEGREVMDSVDKVQKSKCSPLPWLGIREADDRPDTCP